MTDGMLKGPPRSVVYAELIAPYYILWYWEMDERGLSGSIKAIHPAWSKITSGFYATQVRIVW